ncbi:MAG: hypothetical protein ISS95_00840 [Candidatus Aenigmarchaeota archaeon]|nr:hypothetical protein [Candidatus Aenigmarchaeota archaeon]
MTDYKEIEEGIKEIKNDLKDVRGTIYHIVLLIGEYFESEIRDYLDEDDEDIDLEDFCM